MISSELDIEKLAGVYLLADAERERQQTTLRQLEHTLSREGSDMNCAHFMELQACIAQQRQRFEAAQAKAASALAALDEARSRETDREQKELTQRRFAMKQAEFQEAEKALNEHRQNIAALSRELPELERRFNLSLRELGELKNA